MITCLVKGSRYLAAAKAANRGIPFAFVREARFGNTVETTGHVSEEHFAAVAAWFCEAPNCSPFPQGTLLHYSTV